MTPDTLEQRITIALVDFMQGRMSANAGETDMATVARMANVPVGHVQAFLRERGISVSSGTEINWTKRQREELEARGLLPITKPASTSSQQFTLNAGDGNQIQVGHHVAGSQTMVTYQQVLEQLKSEIECSAMPEEEKRTVLQKLGEVMKSPGVAAIINLGATVVRAVVGS